MLHDATAPLAIGFTLIELLVSIAVIGLLLAITMPVMGAMRDRARRASTTELVMGVTLAMRLYADEDPRHFYPTPVASGLLPYDPANPGAVLGLLERTGWNGRATSLDRDPASPTARCLLDGWGRAVRYRLDGPVRIGGAVDAGAVNGIADRPAQEADWNPRGIEPWAYVWSLGGRRRGRVEDARPEHAAHWIYERRMP